MPTAAPEAAWIQSLHGRQVMLVNPSAVMVDPDEIAVALSRLCRFGGHCRAFYSVAQHSVIVSRLVRDHALKLPALLHDAHEAYWGFGDVASPAKGMNQDVARFLRDLASRHDEAIAARFGFDPRLFHHEQIKLADAVALATEARDLMSDPPAPWGEGLPDPAAAVVIEPLAEEEARQCFREQLYRYWNGF